MQQAIHSLIAVPNPICASPAMPEVLALGGQDFAQLLGSELAARADSTEPDLTPATDTPTAQVPPVPIYVPLPQLQALQLPKQIGPVHTGQAESAVDLPILQPSATDAPPLNDAPELPVLMAAVEVSPAVLPVTYPAPLPSGPVEKDPVFGKPAEAVELLSAPPKLVQEAVPKPAITAQFVADAPARPSVDTEFEPDPPAQDLGDNPLPPTNFVPVETATELKLQLRVPMEKEGAVSDPGSLPETIPVEAVSSETLAFAAFPAAAPVTPPPMAVPFVAAQMALEGRAAPAKAEGDALPKPLPVVPIEQENQVNLDPAAGAQSTERDKPAVDNLPLPELELVLKGQEGAVDLQPSSNMVPANGQTMAANTALAPPSAPVFVTQTLPPQVGPDLVDVAKTSPDQGVDLILNPAELGQVRFEMAQRDGILHVSLTVERPETLDLMRRNADQLAQEFRQAGFGATSFSFAGGGGSTGAGAGQGGWAPPPDDSTRNAGYALAEPVLPNRPAVAQSGLNLRL